MACNKKVVMKECTKCKETKELEAFHKRYNPYTKYTSWCKECHKQLSRAWTKNNPKAQAKYRRRCQLKKYGITEADYEMLAISQANCCAICKQKPGKRGLVIDHCHTSGKVRGLLCDNCNMALGLLKENIEILEQAKNYLNKD